MNKPIKRLEVKVNFYFYSDTDTILRGTFKQVSDNILDLEKRLYKNTPEVNGIPLKDYKRVEISIRREWESNDELEFYAIRMETDKEFEARKLKIEKQELTNKEFVKKQREIKKEEELKTYLQLKKKFESKI